MTLNHIKSQINSPTKIKNDSNQRKDFSMSQSNYQKIEQVHMTESSIDSDVSNHRNNRMVDPQLFIQKKKNPLLQDQNFALSARKQQSQLRKQISEFQVNKYYSKIPSQNTSKISSSGQFQYDSTSKKSKMNKSKKYEQDKNQEKIKFYSDQSSVKIQLPSDIKTQNDQQIPSSFKRKKSKSQAIQNQQQKKTYKRLHKKQKYRMKKSKKGQKNNSQKFHTEPIPEILNQQQQAYQTKSELNYKQKNYDSKEKKGKNLSQGPAIQDKKRQCFCQIM